MDSCFSRVGGSAVWLRRWSRSSTRHMVGGLIPGCSCLRQDTEPQAPPDAFIRVWVIDNQSRKALYKPNPCISLHILLVSSGLYIGICLYFFYIIFIFTENQDVVSTFGCFYTSHPSWQDPPVLSRVGIRTRCTLVPPVHLLPSLELGIFCTQAKSVNLCKAELP